MQVHSTGPLSAEETAELQRAEASGAISVHLYRGGVFSEPDFVRYGVLQRLEIRHLLVCEGLVRQDGDTGYAFSLPEAQTTRIAA